MSKAAHLTSEQFNGYQHRTLAPEDLLGADAHIAECDECRERLLQEMGPMAAIRDVRWQLSEHLEYEQIVACAEGSGSPQMEQHLAECELCRAEVQDLREFRGELNSTPRTTVVAMPVRKEKSRVPVWAAIAAGTVLVAGLSVWSLRKQAAPARPVEVAQAVPVEPALTAEQQAAVQAARATGKLERAGVLDRLITKRGVLLGAPGEARTFEIAGPMGTTVLSDRPTFRWQAVPGATEYVVSVFDDAFRKVTESPALAAAEWQPEQGLERGRIYNWQVTAKVRGAKLRSPLPPAPEARFQVAGAEQAVAIETARREHAGNHLLLAVLMAKAGALDDSARELDALAATDAATAQSLRASLEEIRKK